MCKPCEHNPKLDNVIHPEMLTSKISLASSKVVTAVSYSMYDIEKVAKEFD